ncbi:MAG TPA: hypothetical protein VMT29_05960 [Steroidobacteraceae bacterium]|nr:hypothetical protein [Steroidobacteraceae bacterium]
MDESGRKLRAAQRRRTMILTLGSSGHREPDPMPLSGLAAVSLVQQLTRECWALAGKGIPDYTREQTPMRFVPERPK